MLGRLRPYTTPLTQTRGVAEKSTRGPPSCGDGRATAARSGVEAVTRPELPWAGRHFLLGEKQAHAAAAAAARGWGWGGDHAHARPQPPACDASAQGWPRARRAAPSHQPRARDPVAAAAPAPAPAPARPLRCADASRDPIQQTPCHPILPPNSLPLSLSLSNATPRLTSRQSSHNQPLSTKQKKMHIWRKN